VVTLLGRGAVHTAAVTRMPARATAASGLALVLTAGSAALAIGAIVWLVLSWDAQLPDSWGFRGYPIIHAIGFTAVGAVVALRRPANAIGWLLLGAGFISAIGAFGLEYGVYAIVGRAAPLPGGFCGACWSLVLRFRRSSGIEREQIKWLAFSAVPLAVAGLASAVLPDKLGQVLFVFLLLSVPVAIGVAVLRYRLYDIDVLINRALVYGSLSAMLVAVYVAIVLLLQAALRPFTTGSELSVAISTLATLAVVQPLRRRIQVGVNGR